MKLYLSYIIIFFLLACGGNPEPIEYSEKTGIPLKVLVPAGDRFVKLPNSYLPVFFNIASIRDNKSPNTLFLILGEKKQKGAEVYSKAISLFSYTLDSVNYKYIISVPTGASHDYIAEDYSDFELFNGQLQGAIEGWFREQCPDSRCQNFKWDNTYKALIEIDYVINGAIGQ